MTNESDGQARFDWRAFTPEDSPKTPVDLAADTRARDLATPKIKERDAATDFDLPLYDFSDGTERATGERFHLHAAAREQPVALIFGSYT